MSGVSKDTALDVGPGDSRETEGSGETLVTLGVVVLKGDLALDGLGEVPLLSLDLFSTLLDGLSGGEGEDVIDSLGEELGVKLVGHVE